MKKKKRKKETPLPPLLSFRLKHELRSFSPPLPSPPPTPYINYDKKLVAAASVQRLINHLRYATRHELARETIGIGRASGIPLIYLIYLRSSTPINTWIRSRGSECVAFIS